MGVGGVLVPRDDYWPQGRGGAAPARDSLHPRRGRHRLRSHRAPGSRRSTGAGSSPDLLVTAKGITSGYFPLGAVLVGERVSEALDGHPFRHGFTYNGHPTGCAVALANLDIIEREGLLGESARKRDPPRRRPRRDRPAAGRDGGAELRHAGRTRRRSGRRAGALRTRSGRAGILVRLLGGKLVLSPPLTISDDDLDRFSRDPRQRARRDANRRVTPQDLTRTSERSTTLRTIHRLTSLT